VAGEAVDLLNCNTHCRMLTSIYLQQNGEFVYFIHYSKSDVTVTTHWQILWYYTVSQKTVQNCFRRNFVKFPPTFTIFGRKIVKKLNLCEVHSFSTSP